MTALSESSTEATETMIDPVRGEIIDQKESAERLLARAKKQGVNPESPGGLLNQLATNVLETALEAELTALLGHEHGNTPISANVCKGTQPRTVLTEMARHRSRCPGTATDPSSR